MNFISRKSRADRALLDDSCSEAKSLFDAARETAPPSLRDRINRLETYLHRLETPATRHGKVELSRRQRSREVLPTVFRRDDKLMIIGDSAVYMGEEQQSNYSNWLKNMKSRLILMC